MSAFWWEDDGEYAWAEVAHHPDQDAAGREMAEADGCVYTPDGRDSISTQGCECLPTHGVDPGECGGPDGCWEHPGEACEVREKVDCWRFVSWAEAEAVEYADITAELGEDPLVYLPPHWSVVDRQIVSEPESLPIPFEAPSVGMGLEP